MAMNGLRQLKTVRVIIVFFFVDGHNPPPDDCDVTDSMEVEYEKDTHEVNSQEAAIHHAATEDSDQKMFEEVSPIETTQGNLDTLLEERNDNLPILVKLFSSPLA